MGQRAEMLRDRQRYQTLVALRVLVDVYVDEVMERANETLSVRASLRIEDHSIEGFDDLVEERRRTDGTRATIAWQVKKVLGVLERAEVEDLLRAATAHEMADGAVVALARFVEVRGISHLEHLAALCRHVRRAGTNGDLLVSNLQPGEQRWLAAVTVITSGSQEAALALLRRLEVREVHDEATILDRARDRLSLVWGPIPDSLLTTIEKWVAEGCAAAPMTGFQLEAVILGFFEAEGRPVARDPRLTARREYLEALRRGRADVVTVADIKRAVVRRPGGSLWDVYTPTNLARDAALRGSRVEAGPRLLDLARQPGVRVAIIGDVGAGKTVLLEWLRAELAEVALRDDDAPVPVLVHARDLDGTAWREQIGELWQIPPARAARVLSRPWLLLVDGVDEAQRRAWDWIRRVCAREGWRCAGVIAAGRPTHPPTVDRYDLVRLEPWDPEQVGRFLDRWAGFDQSAVEVVRREVRAKHLSPALLQDPLMATLSLLVARADGGVPRSRAGLLDRMTTLRFQEWSHGRLDRDDPKWPEVKEALGELALAYLADGGRPLLEDVVARRLAAVHKDEHGVRSSAIEHYGVLTTLADGRIDFLRRPVAEYLAGFRLSRNPARLHRVVGDPRLAEPVRLAVAIRADNGEVETARSVIAHLLDGAEGWMPGLDVGFLRGLLLAIRIAADLGDAVGELGDPLAASIADVLADETSSWVGDVAANEVQLLARAGGQCWDSILEYLRALAVRFPEDPEAWFQAQEDFTPDNWRAALLHRTPRVRGIAIERLAPLVDDGETRNFLLAEVFDEAVDLLAAPPAVLAGAALRRASRDLEFSWIPRRLREVVAWEQPIVAGAAAVALRPDEADAVVLARALHRIETLRLPKGPVAELGATPAGQQALDDEWPEWREFIERAEEVRLPTADPREPCPPSASVRARIGSACMPAFCRMSAADIRLFTTRARFTHGHAIVRALDSDLSIAEHLQLDELPRDAHVRFGEAACHSPPLRERLLDAWTDLARRPLYPGAALEPLIEAGDEAAAAIYAAWLPQSLYVSGVISPLRPRTAALEHPVVACAGMAHVGQTLADVVDGRRSARGVGVMLDRLVELWRDDRGTLDTLLDLARSASDDDFDGALWALADAPLAAPGYRPIMTAIEAGLRDRLSSLRDLPPGNVRELDAPFWLTWLDGVDLAPKLRPVIEPLADSGPDIAYVAGAVLLPLLSSDEASRLSARIAPSGLTANRRHGRRLLQRYVSAAEEAWGEAALALARSGAALTPFIRTDLLELLPIARRAEVALVLRDSLAAGADVQWVSTDGGIECVRVADEIRRIAYDLGL